MVEQDAWPNEVCRMKALGESYPVVGPKVRVILAPHIFQDPGIQHSTPVTELRGFGMVNQFYETMFRNPHNCCKVSRIMNA